MSAEQEQPALEQVTWQELAALCDTLELDPSHSSSTGRTWLRVDDTVVWAPTEGVRLDDRVPGAWRLQGARIRQWGADLEREEEERLATMTPAQLAEHHKARQRALNQADPPEWLIDRYLERQGRDPRYR